METIMSYLNNVFASLPNTPRVMKIKNDLADSMEEKYKELKRQGKSENEAIGIVISEFGNIDELIDELGIKTDNNKLIIDREEVEAYKDAKRKSSVFVGIGVFLILLGVSSLLAIIQFIKDGILFKSISDDHASIIGLIPLFLFISIAVGLFIFSEVFTAKYKEYEKKGVSLPYSLNEEVKKEYERYNVKFTLSVVAGVVLYILSIFVFIVNIVVFEMEATYSVAILLFSIAVATFILIYFGSAKEAYDVLGVTPEGKAKIEMNKKSEKLISTVASIVWPLTVVAFLLMGFIGGWWHIAWIVFPIVGILFGAFAGAVTNYNKD